VLDFEAFGAVRDFVELGGNVLLILAGVTAVMWMLIYERFWYFTAVHKHELARILWIWNSRREHTSWEAQKTRDMLASQVRMALERRLWLIETLVTLCPMLGLLGTVTGMIEVFDVMAFSGSGNARGMAGGVSKATLPTMAGMVAALSGMLFSIQLRRYALDEGDRVEDSLATEYEGP
jgi:biopolymer transport protein ExbB